MEAGTGAEAMKERCLLAHSSRLAQPAFVYNSGYLPSAGSITGWATNQGNAHTPPQKKENVITAWLQASLMKEFS